MELHAISGVVSRRSLSMFEDTRDVDFSFFVLDSMTHLKFYSALFDFYEMNA